MIRESDSQRQFFCDEINRAQTQGELLQKTAQHKEQRLGCFDFAFKFEALLERLRRSDQFEQPIGSSVRAFPHAHRFGTKSRPKLLLIQRRELAERMNPPLVQNREDLLNLLLTARSAVTPYRSLLPWNSTLKSAACAQIKPN